MSQPDRSDLPETAMADRLAARRERTATAPGPTTKPGTAPASDGMEDRLMARRARQENAEKHGGEGEGDGSLGQQVAREPLFVGLGIRGHHHAGSRDHDAPPVQRAAQDNDPMDRPARRQVGTRLPDAPKPERSRGPSR